MVLLLCLLSCIVFNKKPTYYICSTICKTLPHPLMSFKILSFSLVYRSLNVIWFGVSLSVFILRGVLWGSWICGLVSVINFRKFSAIVTSNMFSVLFIISSTLIFQLQIYHLTLSHSCSMCYYVLGFCCCCYCFCFYRLTFQLEKFLLICVQVYWFFLWPCWVY